MLTHYFDRQGGRARAEALRQEPSAYRAIEAYLRDAAREFANPAMPAGCLVSTSALHCAAENKAAARATAKFRATLIGVLKRKFEEAKRSDQLPDDVDPAALARFYGAVIQGMSAQACDGVDADALNGLVDVAIRAWPGTRPP